MLPEPIQNFIDVFSRLPSIGPRQATRLAFKFVAEGKNKIEQISDAVSNLKQMKICSNCFFVHSNRESLCDICRDQNRDKKTIMIIEKETDLISLERPKKFKGRYLILGELNKSGLLESAQKLRLNNLKNFIKKELAGIAEEIIIATNPTTYGDLQAMTVAKELEGLSKKISRLGRGMPTGGEIEFADEETLTHAIERRN
ncbi:MAG: toprim domain-containing protein [Patescibacteria group bacterium]